VVLIWAGLLFWVRARFVKGRQMADLNAEVQLALPAAFVSSQAPLVRLIICLQAAKIQEIRMHEKGFT
jgi:hypothetical protein